MLFVIGLLMVATSSDSNSDAGLIVSAVGLGGWAVLLLVNAARRALTEQSNGAGGQRTAHLWFAAAGALVAIAVALGYHPTPQRMIRPRRLLTRRSGSLD